MKRHAWLLPVAGLLALGVVSLAVARDDDDDQKAAAAAAPDVQKLADAAADAAALTKQADLVSKKYELKPIMWAFKPKEKGGLGAGSDPQGVELKLIKLGKKPLKDLPTQAGDLEKTAQLTRGIAEITPSYAGKFTKTPAEAKLWTGYADGMKKGADDLAAAVKAGNANDVQKVANKLNESCNDCHTKFRDN